MRKPSEAEEMMKIDKDKKVVTFISEFEELAYLEKSRSGSRMIKAHDPPSGQCTTLSRVSVPILW